MSPFELDLRFVRRIRAFGPFEDRQAQSAARLGLPPWVLVRQVYLDTDDRERIEEQLAEASALADYVAHHFVVVSCGMMAAPNGRRVQISEYVDGVALDQLPMGMATTSIASSVWIGQQLFEAIGHAHSLGKCHGSLQSSSVWIRRSGEVAVDFGLAVASPLANDVYGATSILWRLLTGHPYGSQPDSSTYTSVGSYRSGVPRELEQILEEGLGIRGPIPEASMMADALSRVFYRNLDADDEKDGKSPTSAWIMDKVLAPTDEFEDVQEPTWVIRHGHVPASRGPALVRPMESSGASETATQLVGEPLLVPSVVSTAVSPSNVDPLEDVMISVDTAYAQAVEDGLPDSVVAAAVKQSVGAPTETTEDGLTLLSGSGASLSLPKTNVVEEREAEAGLNITELSSSSINNSSLRVSYVVQGLGLVTRFVCFSAGVWLATLGIRWISIFVEAWRNG